MSRVISYSPLIITRQLAEASVLPWDSSKVQHGAKCDAAKPPSGIQWPWLSALCRVGSNLHIKDWDPVRWCPARSIAKLLFDSNLKILCDHRLITAAWSEPSESHDLSLITWVVCPFLDLPAFGCSGLRLSRMRAARVWRSMVSCETAPEDHFPKDSDSWSNPRWTWRGEILQKFIGATWSHNNNILHGKARGTYI